MNRVGMRPGQKSNSAVYCMLISLEMEAFGDLVENSEYGRLHGWMVSRIAFGQAQLGWSSGNIIIRSYEQPASQESRMEGLSLEAKEKPNV